jgi:hypothetical protein
MNARVLRTVVLAAGIAFAAASALAQEPAPLRGHKHLGPHLAAPQHLDVTGRVEQIDERIAMLKADMRMFAGEMKIQVMAELIETLIERQYLIERRGHPMLEMIEEWMPHARPPAEPDAVPDAEALEPETMCSPLI